MTYSPRNPPVFEPARELGDALEQFAKAEYPYAMSEAPIEALADMLLDKDRVYTNERMPRGFRLSVTVVPVKNAIILGGLELVDGKRYNLVVEVGWTHSRKRQELRGWTFREGVGWRSAGFVKSGDGYSSTSRFPREQDLVSIEEAE